MTLYGFSQKTAIFAKTFWRMRVLIINTSERIGGAAVAASRLMEALKNNGIKAKMLVRDKQTDQISVVGLDRSWLTLWKFVWERIVIWKANHFKKNNLFAVDIANTGTDVTSLPEFRQADIIHLHWINQGMLSLKNLSKILESGKPIIWTMHDMWPSTGICHHARECTNYQHECHHCPFLYGGGNKKDLSARIFRKKKELYKAAPITFVTCSHWLEEKAKSSALLTGHTVTSIPNPINTNLFRPRNKQEARVHFRLPQEGKLLLFGSVKITDKRKGIDYLIESCKLLAEKHPELKSSLGVVVFGNQSQQLTNLLPFPVYALDYVSNEHELVNIYNAVNLFVTPSLEENLPNTIMEAMACGVPCVGFNVGGIPEMIDHLHNGYVAQYKSSEDFANGIYWALTESENPILAEQASRKAIANYSESIIAKKYIEVYNKITGKHA
ncbi:glycosyl transferase [Bacteroides nordii]|nr:glycosyl transferase [Bacteroides nordii]